MIDTHTTDMNAKQTGPSMNRRGVLVAAGIGWAILAGGLGIGSMLGMAPEPESVPRRWELRFEPGPLRVASVNVPDVGPRMFLYLTYRVTNNSGEDVFFAPSFDFSDGEGNVTRSGRDVPQAVNTQLKELVQGTYIQDQVQIIGDILQGEAHAKEGLVIWPLADMNPSEVVIYATGMSGESKTVTAPNGKDKFVVRKTVRLEYKAGGSMDGIKSTPIELVGRGWIMR